MDRRSMVAIPGIAALAAARAFSQTSESVTPGDGSVLHASRKALIKHSGAKSAYKVPKNATKQTKYLNSLTALLSLTSGQKQQISAIYTGAVATRGSIQTSIKTTRKALHTAVKNYDSGAISQSVATLGNLLVQHITNGAMANAAVFQILTPDQQVKLSQYQG
jgi:Spy/CpxP family protein refolding chaperone